MLKQHFLAIIFSIFIFILIISTYKDYGLPWDEKVFFNTGKYYAIKILDYLSLPHNLTNNGFEPTPHHIRGHGVFYDVIIIFASLPFKNFNFETLHLLRALFSLPIFFLVYWIVSQMFSKIYGLISLVFLLLFPRFYPEIYYNAVDVPTTLFFTISLAYFIYYSKDVMLNSFQHLNQIPKQVRDDKKKFIQTTLKSILFGLILAITINQRLLLFYLPIVNFIFLFIIQKRNLKQFAIHQFVIFASLILFLHLTHPYLLTHPITGLIDILNSAKQYPWNAAVLFAGQFYQAGVKPLPWYYLPKSMLITIPLGILFLFFVGNISLLYKIVRGRTSEVEERSGKTSEVKIRWQKLFYFYLLLIFYLPFFLVFIFKPTLYDSWRQFLFLTIPIIVIAIFGLNWILDIGNWEFIGHWKLGIGIFILINLFITLIKIIELHPYEYLYYNSLVGDLKGAYGKYETDYWGLGFKEAVLWFKQNINDPKKEYKIFVEGDPLSSSYYFKPNMQLTTDLLKANYIFIFTRWNFHLRHPGKTIYTVKKEGVPLIFIKEL